MEQLVTDAVAELNKRFEAEYVTGADHDAHAYGTEVVGPLVRSYHDDDVDPGTDVLAAAEETDASSQRSHNQPHSVSTGDLYDRVRETVDPDAYDVTVGVWSGSSELPFMIEDELETDSTVVRYSRIRRGDDEVLDPAAGPEFDGADVLVLDDLISSGRTIETVAAHLYDQGAESVDAHTAKTKAEPTLYRMEPDSPDGIGERLGRLMDCRSPFDGTVRQSDIHREGEPLATAYTDPP